MVNKNQRTIDKQDKELNDDILALFLVSTLTLSFFKHSEIIYVFM